MRSSWLACFAMLSLSARAAPPSPTLIQPDQAIALANAASPRTGAAGRFTMRVATTGRVGGALILNSSSDYRAPDDLSFRLSPNVVAALVRRYGASPEDALRGRTVVIDGTVRRQLIIDRDDYFPDHVLGADRWQHTVRILLAHQIVAID